MSYTRYNFKCNFAAMLTVADMPAASTDTVKVLFNLRHDGGTACSSAWEPVPLRLFVRGEDPRPQGQPKKAIEHKKDELFEQMVVDMPWLQHLDLRQGFVASMPSTEEATASTSAMAEDLFEIDEETLLSALSAVDKARAAECEIGIARGHVNFRSKECCDPSTFAKTGIYHDAVQGKCDTPAADEWARRRKFQVTFKCTFAKRDEVPSRIIVRSWCHKMQWLFDTELASHLDDFQFAAEMMAGYMEPDELTALVPKLKKKEPLNRAHCIRKIPF